MTSIDDLRSRPTPRDPRLVEPLARDLEPVRVYIALIGFFVWLSLSGFVGVTIAILIGGMRAMGVGPPPPTWLVCVGLIVGAIVGVLLFSIVVRLVRKRRDLARRLYAHGVVLDASIVKTWSHAQRVYQRGIQTFSAGAIGFDAPDGAKIVRLPLRTLATPYAMGEKYAVLYEPSARWLVAFALGGAGAGSAIVLRRGA